MTHVLLINGPPRSGKDTAGELITDAFPGTTRVKMATALKRGTHALFRALHDDLQPTHLANVMNAATYEQSKDTPMPLFYDLTPREAYIAVSEHLCKRMFGHEFFGTIIAEKVQKYKDVRMWVVTDCGFAPECQPIIRTVGPENVTLLRLHRQGCDFAGDSRRYVELPNILTHDIHNDGTLADLSAKMVRLGRTILP